MIWLCLWRTTASQPSMAILDWTRGAADSHEIPLNTVSRNWCHGEMYSGEVHPARRFLVMLCFSELAVFRFFHRCCFLSMRWKRNPRTAVSRGCWSVARDKPIRRSHQTCYKFACAVAGLPSYDRRIVDFSSNKASTFSGPSAASEAWRMLPSLRSCCYQVQGMFWNIGNAKFDPHQKKPNSVWMRCRLTSGVALQNNICTKSCKKSQCLWPKKDNPPNDSIVINICLNSSWKSSQRAIVTSSQTTFVKYSIL